MITSTPELFTNQRVKAGNSYEGQPCRSPSRLLLGLVETRHFHDLSLSPIYNLHPGTADRRFHPRVAHAVFQSFLTKSGPGEYPYRRGMGQPLAGLGHGDSTNDTRRNASSEAD